MPIELLQRPSISEGDTDVVAINYTDYLDSGELIASVNSVAEVTTTDLTIANTAVSTAELTILGETVAIGAAVQFSVTGQQAGQRYRIRVTTTTDGTPARIAVRDLLLDAV